MSILLKYSKINSKPLVFTNLIIQTFERNNIMANPPNRIYRGIQLRGHLKVQKHGYCETGTFLHPLISFSVHLVHSGGDIGYLKKICFFNENRLVETRTQDSHVLVIGERIINFLNGGKDDFMDLQLDFGGLTPFQVCVLETARTIPRGCTVNYQELAQMSGHLNAVRAVASVMRNNRFPLVIPCHRVVRKDGNTGGYCGEQSGRMFLLKQKLLDLEKVSNNHGRM